MQVKSLIQNMQLILHMLRVKTCSATLWVPQLSSMFRDHLTVITSKDCYAFFISGGVMVLLRMLLSENPCQSHCSRVTFCTQY